MNKIVLVSGGFDPIHSGHIKLIKEASKYGNVVVLLNSDQWLKNKKGIEFLPFKEREIVMMSLKNVIDVISCGNIDNTCIDGLEKVIKKYKNYEIFFANGGDRTKGNTPEMSTCRELDVTMLWGIGGGKIQSSSWLIKGEKSE